MSTPKKQDEALTKPISNAVIDKRLSNIEQYDSYDEFIVGYKAKLEDLRKKVLVEQWDLGGQIYKLMKTAKYGDKLMEKLAKAFSISTQTLYSYRLLFELFDKSAIDKFASMQFGGTTLSKLASIKNLAEREAVAQKLLSGEMTPSQVDAYKIQLQAAPDRELPNDTDTLEGEDAEQANKAADNAKPVNGGAGQVKDIPITKSPPTKPNKAPTKDSKDKSNASAIRKVWSKLETISNQLTPTLFTSAHQVLDKFDLIDSDDEATRIANDVSDTITRLAHVRGELDKAIARAKQVMGLK